ncbi:MAG: ECF transporter S component [Emergencia sp.]
MAQNRDLTRSEAARRKRTLFSAALIIIAMPVTIALGMLFDQSRYMVISVLILIYTMLPFFMVFEKRKPKAREIVLIAMMSALTVCAQIFFHMTIPIQIGTAMVIISGISLGPEAGFLIGAISRFVCNFYMGQGPWTPWQMFCWGLLGFLAGLAFNKVDLDQLKSRNFKVIMGPVVCIIFAMLAAWISYQLWPGEDEVFGGWRLYVFGAAGLLAGVLIQRRRLPVDGITLTVYTFLTVFVIYGGVMNICALVTSAGIPGGNTLDLAGLRALYISGMPYDLYHAGTAALCAFFFGDSIIRKLERIKIKYGIYK